MIKTLPTAGIAHLLESSPPKTRTVLWQLIDKEVEGEVIQYLNEDLQSAFLSELNANKWWNSPRVWKPTIWRIFYSSYPSKLPPRYCRRWISRIGNG